MAVRVDVCWQSGWICVGATPHWRVRGASCAINGIEQLNDPSGSRGICWRARAVGAFIDGTGLITTGSGTMPGVLLRVVRLCSLLVVFNTCFAVGFQVSMIRGAFVMRGIVRMGVSVLSEMLRANLRDSDEGRKT
jgi:hypothetical protein